MTTLFFKMKSKKKASKKLLIRDFEETKTKLKETA